MKLVNMEYPWSLTQSVAPAVEPVSVADMKLHLKQDSSHDDGLITDLIVSARELIELTTRRSLVNATYILILDSFPQEIRPPRSPLSSVTSVAYLDTDGNSQTASAATVYQTDTSFLPGRISLREGADWPDTQDAIQAVTVTFVAGHGAAAANVPAALRQALKILVAHWYDPARSLGVTGTIFTKLPQAYESLIAPYSLAGSA